MSEAPKTIQEILRKLTDVLRSDIFSDEPKPPPPGEIIKLYNDDAYWTVLPSFFYWLPRGRRVAGSETLRQVRDDIGRFFPHIGVTGRSRWADIAIGGAVMQLVDFRIFIVVAAPAAVDVVERINNTLAWFSMIILNRHSVPPYWWFTEVREIEPLFRTQLFPNWTFGYLGGTLRCHPQVLPFLYNLGGG